MEGQVLVDIEKLIAAFRNLAKVFIFVSYRRTYGIKFVQFMLYREHNPSTSTLQASFI